MLQYAFLGSIFTGRLALEIGTGQETSPTSEGLKWNHLIGIQINQ